MKKNKLMIAAAVVAVAVAAFSSCKKDKETTDDSTVAALALGESAAGDADKMAKQVLFNGTVTQRLSDGNAQSGILGCAVVTNDSVNQIITIDFGSGCVGQDGINRSGKIIVNYTGGFFIQGTVVTMTFNSYVINGRKLEGQRTITNQGTDADNNMYWLVEANGMKLTDADGKGRSWNSNRTWTRIGGGATTAISDDTYRISGTASGSFSDGRTFTSLLTDIIEESTCNWIPSGTLKIVVNGEKTYFANFGEGTCDNIVTVTYPDGSVHDLQLK